MAETRTPDLQSTYQTGVCRVLELDCNHPHCPCDLASQEFSTVIDHQMELEPVKPAHGTLAALGELGKYLVMMNTRVVTYQHGGTCPANHGGGANAGEYTKFVTSYN